jgi:CHAT domain-containing protein/tetratricopeptide (TPR) repeat protein
MSQVNARVVLVVVATVLCFSSFAFAQQEADPRIKQLAEKLFMAKTESERQALLSAEKELVTAELVAVLFDSTDKLRLKGDYEQALGMARFTQVVAEQIGDQVGAGRAVTVSASVYLSRGEYETAMEYFQKALALLEQAKYHRGVAYALTNMGLIHRLQGDFDKALEFYRQGLKMSEAAGDKRGVANVLNLMGVVHRLQGNGRLALEYYQKALALFEEVGFQPGIAGMLNNIGNLYLQQGQYEQAEVSFRKSLALAEKLKNRPQVGQALNNIGRTYRLRLDNVKALEFFRQSLAIREELGDKLGVARTLHNIAETHTGNDLREYHQALDYYQKALALFESLGNKHGVAETTAGIMQLYVLSGDYKSALLWSERALSLARETEKDTLWQVLANVGAVHKALKQFDKARAAFAESIAVIEEMRAQVAGGEQDQQRFFEVNISPYQAMVELLVTQNQWNEAFAYAEQAKARVLLDVLQSGRVNIAKAMTALEQEQERKLRAEMITLNAQVTSAGQSAKPDAARLADFRTRQQKARLAYEGFQTNLYAAHPELKVQRGEMRPLSLTEAGALITDTQRALIEYVVTEEKTFLFVLTKEGAGGRAPLNLKVHTLDVRQKDLAEMAERFRGRIARRALTYGEDGRRLYDLLLKPAEAQLHGKDALVIVPDGKLWDLPFQALQNARGRHLIEDHAISYAPSLTVLSQMMKSRRTLPAGASPSTSTLLAVGNPALGKETIERVKTTLMDENLGPLPEAEKQVKALGEMYGAERSRVYVGREAREARVKAEAGGYRILQLATHGILNDAAPMYSNVLLAQEDTDRTEDGLLEAWELMNLNLRADLVVLSACETARGRYGAGEGMIGLTWALFVAGSPTTVVSQWKVEEASTTELMMEFHRNLRLNKSVAAATRMSTARALQHASMKMLGGKQYQHPFYWASFVVIGDDK